MKADISKQLANVNHRLLLLLDFYSMRITHASKTQDTISI